LTPLTTSESCLSCFFFLTSSLLSSLPWISQPKGFEVPLPYHGLCLLRRRLFSLPLSPLAISLSSCPPTDISHMATLVSPTLTLLILPSSFPPCVRHVMILSFFFLLQEALGNLSLFPPLLFFFVLLWICSMTRLLFFSTFCILVFLFFPLK